MARPASPHTAGYSVVVVMDTGPLEQAELERLLALLALSEQLDWEKAALLEQLEREKAALLAQLERDQEKIRNLTRRLEERANQPDDGSGTGELHPRNGSGGDEVGSSRGDEVGSSGSSGGGAAFNSSSGANREINWTLGAYGL